MEQERIVTSHERERVVDTVEDVEFSEEIKVAAARERAEYLTKEVTKGTQQMQNIMLHMQQVLHALAAVRASLQLKSVSDDPASIVEDKRRVMQLKEKITEYQNELLIMKQKMGDVLQNNNSDEDIETRRQVEKLLGDVEKIFEHHS